MSTTHEVTNQAPPVPDHDASDYPVYLEALARHDVAPEACERVREVGRAAGSAETAELGILADRHHPFLHTHDRYGHRQGIDACHQFLLLNALRECHTVQVGGSTTDAHPADS